MTTKLKIYKVNPEVVLPKFATEQAACFDISMQMYGKVSYKGYNQQNKEFERPHNNGALHIMPGDRIMVPTGLIMDIPLGYSVRLHSRSGLSLKQGLVLVNAEGIIDSDYVEEVFVLMTNVSEIGVWINTGDRICQAELVKDEKYAIEEAKSLPKQKSNRKGGMGSTGVGKNA